MPIPMLSEIMGHSDIKTTMVYAKFVPSSAALWMARVFDQVASEPEAANTEPVTLAARRAKASADGQPCGQTRCRSNLASTSPRNSGFSCSPDSPPSRPRVNRAVL